jgi:hypothetical protein
MSLRPAFSFFTLSVLFLAATSCSLYQSEGRKFLEKQAITFANNSTSASSWSFKAKQIEEPCAELTESPKLDSSKWSEMDSLPEYNLQVFQTEISNAFDILIRIEKSEKYQHRHFLCAFYYKSLHDRNSQLPSDLDISLETVRLLENSARQ